MSSVLVSHPIVIVLLGPPGAGKGTHAGPLSEKLSLPHISTGDLFRNHIREQTKLGAIAKSFIDAGKLVPDEIALDMLFERIGKADCVQGCILDGFPRTVAQAKALDLRFKEEALLVALNFDIPDEALVERIVGRIACKDCGRPFHLRFDPPKNPARCDGCGGTLYQRADDTVEIVRKRLEVYHNQTKPLIDYYQQSAPRLKNIDSNQRKDLVLSDLLEAVMPLFAKC